MEGWIGVAKIDLFENYLPQYRGITWKKGGICLDRYSMEGHI